ncbi:MAG: hypothetical protein GX811_11560, partial [Lentisphaerae bacterium]|nr:hypothetical protein [Lentisphaerota bacterium]
MKKQLQLALVVLVLALFTIDGRATLKSSKWEDQPEELQEIVQRLASVSDEKGVANNKRTSSSDEILKLKSEIDQYSQSHSGTNLNWHYWGNSVESIYRLASRQVAKNYGESEAFVLEGVRLLQASENDDPNAALIPMLHLIVFHVHDWVESHPIETGQLWDSSGKLFSHSESSYARSLWEFHRATVESRILDNLGAQFG